MNAETVKAGVKSISRVITENREYLIKLDQQNGDGDLGISMSEGFTTVENFFNKTEETDLGKLMMQAGGVLNESAPSSLGTILSFAFIGMAKSLK
ncbi:MAG: DAK2 domain-containing protein [Clostridiales bacterium]|nr:DAK2 domain-containing protein [Clostridiales bacterium]